MSISRLCRILGVPRSSFYYKRRPRERSAVDGSLAARIKQIIQSNPGLRDPEDLGGRDDWCHLVAVMDCCDREVIGWCSSPAATGRRSETMGCARSSPRRIRRSRTG